MSGLQVGKAIYNILSSDEEVTNKVENKIYPLIADLGTSFPFIVYKRTSITPSTSKDRYISSEQVIVDVVIASDTYNDSVEVADIVRKSLQGKGGIYSNIEIVNIEFISANEEYIEDSFIQNLTFKITIK